MSTQTLDSLQKQAASLPQRIVGAVLVGDGDQLAQLVVEKQVLPSRMFAAEIVELRDRVTELRAELAVNKAAVVTTGAVVKDLVAQRKEIDRRILEAERVYGHAKNGYEFTQMEIRKAGDRIEELASQQMVLAQSLTARPGWRQRP